MKDINSLMDFPRRVYDLGLEKIRKNIPDRFFSGILVGASVISFAMLIPDYNTKHSDKENNSVNNIIQKTYIEGYFMGLQSGIKTGFQLKGYLDALEMEKNDSLEDSTNTLNNNII